MSEQRTTSREESGCYDASDDEIYMFQRVHPALKTGIFLFDLAVVALLISIVRYIFA
ncbi:MAG: hypothetical protein O2794_03415 [bacterium]|nr:hypothetical protein [bacterium]